MIIIPALRAAVGAILREAKETLIQESRRLEKQSGGQAPPRFLTVKDAAELFRVSEKSIYQWVKEGRIPSRKVGDTTRFLESELLEWTAKESSARRVSSAVS